MRRIYRAVTLFAGNIVFDEIGVLQAHEFDGEAIFDVPHHAALGFANRDDDADQRPQIGRDANCGTRLRQVRSHGTRHSCHSAEPAAPSRCAVQSDRGGDLPVDSGFGGWRAK